MTWHIYQADFQLRSPLHVGERKIGTNLQVTRHFVPARNVWAALTERITRGSFLADSLPRNDYADVGSWVQEHVALSYLFVVDEDKLMLDESKQDFERLYVASQVSTAINPMHNAAEDESLHEVEFISPRRLKDGKQTCLRGWFMLDELALPFFADKATRRPIVDDLWLGGERRYGFGHLQMSDWKQAGALDRYAVDLDGNRPIVIVPSTQPVLAHVKADKAPQMQGNLEVLVGRETTANGHFGKQLTQARICWSPAAKAVHDCRFAITAEGLWDIAN